MIIKHYAIDLPADYDMRIIRDRVARAAATYDVFPGLGLKAFLIREKGRHGADSNQYAPVYLWPQVEALWEFVAGPGFDGIAQSFGRPPIQTWLGLALARSTEGCDPARVRSAVRAGLPLERGTDLAVLRAHETSDARHTVEHTPGSACARLVSTSRRGNWSGSICGTARRASFPQDRTASRYCTSRHRPSRISTSDVEPTRRCRQRSRRLRAGWGGRRTKSAKEAQTRTERR